MTLERTITAGLILACLVLFFWVLPTQVENVDYGRIIPSTVPSIAIWIIVGAAALQLWQSKEKISMDVVVCIRTFGFFGLLALAVYTMDQFGFEYVAPFLALAVMLIIGERRWYWLIAGGVVIPIGVWLIVERLLDRPLA